MKTMKEQDDIARRNQLVHDLDLRDTINRLESRLAWSEGMLERAKQAFSYDRTFSETDTSYAVNWLSDYASGPSDGTKGEE